MDLERFALHCGVALGLGILIGIERQWTQHPAGLRTNALVALGAAMFVGLSLPGGGDSQARLAAQVVSGLGFLGGGVILREGLNVHGLNTAATIWCAGAVGSLAGAGHPYAALIGAIGVLFLHLALRPLVLWIDARKLRSSLAETYYRLRVECAAAHEAHVRAVLMRHVAAEKKLNLHALASTPAPLERTSVVAEVYSMGRDDRAVEEVVAAVCLEQEVAAARWERA